MKTKLILLTCVLTISFILSAQDFRKFGIGVGYSTSSIVGDSVSPFELSLRYRINDKHTIQMYAPLWLKQDKQVQGDDKPDYMKQEHLDMFNHTYTHSLWGMGAGYDYTFYSYFLFNFFTGVNADFQWYEYREDSRYMYYGLIQAVSRPTVYDDYYKEERLSYYWDRVKGISIVPNTGIRFSTPKLTAEAKINLYVSRLNKQAYYFGKRKGIWEDSWTTWESFYPDKNREELSIRPYISFHLSYYFGL